MTNRHGVFGAGLLLMATAGSIQASTITDWNFGALPVNASANTPAPTTGTGTASALGMTNGYTYGTNTGSVNADDIASDAQTGTQTGSTLGNGNVWRIRGQSPGNGWNTAAPQYSQGTEYDISTSGYNTIGLSFNWAATTQGVSNLQVQYNTNINNVAGWTNIGSLLSATVDNGTPGAVGYGFQTNTVNFSGVNGASNDPLFGIRLVSAFNPTLGNYASATSALAGSPKVINNTSGNWRFADVQINGTAITPVPLPASLWLMLSGLGGLGILFRPRRARLNLAHTG